MAQLPLGMPGVSTQSRSALDLTEAAISGAVVDACGEVEQPLPDSPRAAPSITLPHQDAQFVTHIALDIGGSLVKLVYFSQDQPPEQHQDATHLRRRPVGGRLHFVKFETRAMESCLDFIVAKGLHRYQCNGEPRGLMRVMATGGGAHKFAELFKARLGLQIEKIDEIESLVAGCNFLCRAIRHEVFKYENGKTQFIVHSGEQDVFPYLLVNIGSGVSLIKVDADGKHDRVSGSSLGGGTFWGLARLLTRASSFDQLLDMCAEGNNSKVDMLVGDIYGGRDYTSIGLSANTIASSFGKVISDNKDLEDYKPADMALAALRMISYNIGQLAYLNAKRYGLTRILFGGFFIRGHPYTMETISFAIRFWSKGEMAALFLRHEGFLGAVGAFLKVNPMGDSVPPPDHKDAEARKVQAHFVERWPMGAPYSGNQVHGPPIRDVGHKIEWVERFVQLGTAATEEARHEHDRAAENGWRGLEGPTGSGTSLTEVAAELEQHLHILPTHPLYVGTLHYVPQYEPFPLLVDSHYEPNTFDIRADAAERDYWCSVLSQQIGAVAEKAVLSCAGGAEGEEDMADVKRRAAAFARAFGAHLQRLQRDPSAYGHIGLSELFELREDCLHEFGFEDIYRRDKERENNAALEVLPDLFHELDGQNGKERLLSLIEGVLAANIFDWGARACVELYHNGTILEIYKQARTTLSQRPWRVDHFDKLASKWFCKDPEAANEKGALKGAYSRVIMFVDNAGADIVLGMLPLARELLRNGAQVIMAANSRPAINDVTANELVALLAKVSLLDPLIASARQAAISLQAAWRGSVPPPPGIPRRVASTDKLGALDPSRQAGGPPVTARLSPRRSVSAQATPVPAPQSTNPAATSFEDAQPATAGVPTSHPTSRNNTACSQIPDNAAAAAPAHARQLPASGTVTKESSDEVAPPVSTADRGGGPTPQRDQAPDPGIAYAEGPALFVVASGSGSPCLDLRHVTDELADAAVCDHAKTLVIIEGMGRSIHTNHYAKFRCDSLKLAMIKNKHVAQALCGGEVYDCVCRFDEAST